MKQHSEQSVEEAATDAFSETGYRPNDDYKSYKNGFIRGSQWQKEREWVSVEIEKPPLVEFVLCYSPSGSISFRCFSRTHEMFTTQEWIEKLKVTHWKLPTPPTK